MAQFEFDENQMNGIIKQLEEANIFDDETAKEMLFEGAKIFVDEAKAQIEKSGHVDTGKMLKGVGFTKKIKTSKTGAKSVTVTVKGKDKNGTSNAVKAFVLNYGRRENYGAIVGSHFWNIAKQKSQPEITRKIEEIATKKLKEKGLI